MSTHPGPPGLSAREREIVAAVARGLSNRDIAAEAGIAQQTVKNHLSSIFRKLQVKSRVQLAVFAIRHGFADWPGNGEQGPDEPASGV
jgi:two-component system nitrate/nitrite response regulator NarL